MKSQQKNKVSQSNDVNFDEQKKNEEQRVRKEEELSRKREEYRETLQRGKIQKEQAEEGKKM